MRFALLRVFPDPTLRRETYQTSSLPADLDKALVQRWKMDCLDQGCELMFAQVLSIKDPTFASRCAVESHVMLEWIADCGWELQSVASGGWVASGGGVVASGVEVYVFFRSDSEDPFDPLK